MKTIKDLNEQEWFNLMSQIDDVNQRDLLRFYGLLCGVAALSGVTTSIGNETQNVSGYKKIHFDLKVAYEAWAYATEQDWTGDDLRFIWSVPDAFPTVFSVSEKAAKGWDFLKQTPAVREYLEAMFDVEIDDYCCLRPEDQKWIMSYAYKVIEESGWRGALVWVKDMSWQLHRAYHADREKGWRCERCGVIAARKVRKEGEGDE